MSRPFYFESEPPPEVDELLANRVKALMAEYSLPYEVAQQKATEMLTYFDRYGVTIGTAWVGAGSVRTREAMGATSTQAVSVLLPATKGGVHEDLLEQAGMPWDVGVEEAGETDEEVQPHKTILGKEILDKEWENFLNVGVQPDDEEIPEDDTNDA